MTHTPDPSPRKFNEEFRQSFRDLILWRRDVRRFRRDPIDPLLMHSLLELASHAPSVGHYQPWRFVLVESTERREEVKSSFARANARALENYYGEQRAHYARLKLEGLENAPVHVAVFADEAAEEGSGLVRPPRHARDSALFSRGRGSDLVACGTRRGVGTWLGLHSRA
jgi:5,6-dimethylbenzimidazole synthase